jgi:hypothetical protein
MPILLRPMLAATATLAVASTAHGEAPAVGHSAPAVGQDLASAGFDAPLLTIAEAKARYRGRLSQTVLRFLSVMDAVVNKDKATLTEADWAQLGGLLDRDRFHRVGNSAEHMGWQGYSALLAGWAKANWWKGYIWRMSEVPGSAGKPGLVYLEAQERSSSSGPVTEGGKTFILESISVYVIDRNNKIVGLHVYDHRPR